MASKTSSKRAAMRASMIAEMEVLLDEYLDWYEGTEDLKFRELEAEILQLRKKMGAKLAEVVVEEERKAGAVVSQCPKCGEAVRNKGRKKKRIVSLAGEVEVNRGYYYCPRCRSGHFPPGHQNGNDIGME